MEAAKSSDGSELASQMKGGAGFWLRVSLEGNVSRIVGGIGQGRDTTSIEGRQKGVMWGTNGDNPNGHCDVRGSQRA